MEDKPLVSIWMVTYNHENYIEQSINSILAQKTNFKYKLFIGDDKSIDRTAEICIDYQRKFPNKIEVFVNETNVGPNLNAINIYNACLNSGAKYMALCEGDDYWIDPLKLQKQVDFLEQHSDFTICFHDVKIYHQESRSLEEDTITKEVPQETSIIDLAKRNYIHTPTVMVKNNFTLPKWFAKVPLGDWSLYMIVARNGKIKKLNEAMAVYRMHHKSSWSSKDPSVRDKKTIETIKIHLKEGSYAKEVKHVLQYRIANSKPSVEYPGKYFLKRIGKFFK
tara:strand:- start:53 stop:889 length:837 start_codon:yes stop_codon:yes gene_type:complete